jgi:hypothetical protein
MENNQLAVYQNFDSISKAANALQKSGYFKDVTSEAQAIVKVMAGAELGLPPFASMSGIHIISGKPALGSNVIATLVKNDPRYNYKIVECNNKVCTIAWTEDGQPVGESSFTMDEATTAGLTNNPSWKKFPSDMLFARAITRGARRFAPGIFGGSPIYTPEELGAEVDEDGYIDTTHRIVEEPNHPAVPDSSLVDQVVELGGKIKSSMSLETAENMVDSKGKRYGDMTNDDLSGYSIGIGKLLAKNGLTPEKHDEYQMKLDAIGIILASRNK